MKYGEMKKLREQHKKLCKEKSVSLKGFRERLGNGREIRYAINTKTRGIGGSIYHGKPKGTKIYYKTTNSSRTCG